MRILFISSTRIGDGILAASLLPAITSHYHLQPSKDEIWVVCGELIAPYYQDFPLVNKIIALTKRPYNLHWLDLWRTVTQSQEKWDMVIDLRNSVMGYCLQCRQAKPIKIFQPNRADLNDKTHQLDYLFAMFKGSKGALSLPKNLPLYLNPAIQTQAKKKLSSFPNHFIAFGIGANSTIKIWPIDYFYQLALQLQQKLSEMESDRFNILPVLLLGDEQDGELAKAFLKLASKDDPLAIHDLTGQFSLMENAAIMQHANLFIGNDSGLMHLAAACHIPTLGLFGPTPAMRYRPYGEKCAHITTPNPIQDNMKNLTVKMVLEATMQLYQKNMVD